MLRSHGSRLAASLIAGCLVSALADAATLTLYTSTAAINVAGPITVSGANNVINIAGSGFAAGQFPLIKYNSGSLASLSGFKLGTLPSGVSAVLTNNTINRAADLNIQ
jgi:hypothetical protein